MLEAAFHPAGTELQKPLEGGVAFIPCPSDRPLSPTLYCVTQGDGDNVVANAGRIVITGNVKLVDWRGRSITFTMDEMVVGDFPIDVSLVKDLSIPRFCVFIIKYPGYNDEGDLEYFKIMIGGQSGLSLDIRDLGTFMALSGH